MKLFDLSGKTALITGASSGIGEQFDYTLVQSGARVILASRRIEKLEELALQLKNAVAIKMDVANKISVSNAFKQIENERIDICINCAGIAGTIITPMTAYRVGTKEGKLEHAKKIPLGFVAEPNDLDGTLLYLACNKASTYVITGACITVDGGVTWGGT
jgi:NAD(P)-dependent dehydrogenase (short-subunit alcohol dehydrogenase family)